MHPVFSSLTMFLSICALAVLTCITAAILERNQQFWLWLEHHYPMFRFGDTNAPPVGGPPKIEYRYRPRDPSSVMLDHGAEQLLERFVEVTNVEGEDTPFDREEARMLCQFVWVTMWMAWDEETSNGTA